MIDSTNPRMLADQIRALWDKVKSITGLPATTSATAGQILKLDSDKEATWAEEYSYTPPSYSSTEEVNTGQKWIDGRDIYSIVLTGNLPEIASGSTTTSIASFDGKEVITTSGYAISTTGSRVPLNSNPSGAVIGAYQGATGSVRINANTSFSESPYWVVVNYVKTPATREEIYRETNSSYPNIEVTKSRKKSNK